MLIIGQKYGYNLKINMDIPNLKFKEYGKIPS